MILPAFLSSYFIFVLSFSPSQNCFLFHPAWNSRQSPGVLQFRTGWPVMLHLREYSDSVAQLQFGWPGRAQAAMSAWQLSISVSFGTLHPGDTRVSSWLQIWA